MASPIEKDYAMIGDAAAPRNRSRDGSIRMGVCLARASIRMRVRGAYRPRKKMAPLDWAPREQARLPAATARTRSFSETHSSTTTAPPHRRLMPFHGDNPRGSCEAPRHARQGCDAYRAVCASAMAQVVTWVSPSRKRPPLSARIDGPDMVGAAHAGTMSRHKA